jgi:hypothetical protein
LIPVKQIRQIQSGLKTLVTYLSFCLPVVAFMLIGALCYGLFFSSDALKTAGEWMSKDSRGIFIIGVSTISGLLLAISQEIRLKLESKVVIFNKQNIWNLRLFKDLPNGCKAGLHSYLSKVANRLESMDLINSNVIGSRDFFDYPKLDGYISLIQFMNLYLSDLDELPLEYREAVMSKFHERFYSQTKRSFRPLVHKTRVWWFFHQILGALDIKDSPQSIDLVVKSMIFHKVKIGPHRIDPFQSISLIRRCRINYYQFEKISYDLIEFLDRDSEMTYLDRFGTLVDDPSTSMIEKMEMLYIEFFNSKEK